VFFTGMGTTSYMNSISWAQPFCRANQTGCGPTVPPPPVMVQYALGGSCLTTNSTFPCAGGWANTCPIFLGSCEDPHSIWEEQSGGTIASVAFPGNCINLDCNDCTAGTVAKIGSCATMPSLVAYTSGSGPGLLQYTCPAAGSTGMCLNNGATTPTPPCKAGEFYRADQTQLQECTAADAQGWTRSVVNSTSPLLRASIHGHRLQWYGYSLAP
jgi:hypothetical protein